MGSLQGTRSLSIRRLSMTRLFALLLVVTLLLCSLLYFTLGARAERRVAAQLGREQFSQIASLIFRNLHARMGMGWDTDAISDEILALERQSAGLQVRVYRAASVDAQFGEGDARYHPAERPEDVERAMRASETQFIQTDSLFRFSMPALATPACLECHQGAVPGEALGTIAVASLEHSMRSVIGEAFDTLSIAYYALAALSILIGFLLVDYVLVQPVRLLSRHIQQSLDTGHLSEMPGECRRCCEDVLVLQENFDRLMRRVGSDQAAMQELADTDALTGLCNRRRFFPQFQSELHRASRYEEMLALIAIDLNGFKALNDLHGHDAGDRVLAAVAKEMRDVLRDEGLIARIGGDEFLALVPRVPEPALAGRVAQRIEAAVASVRVDWWGHELRVTASTGIALFPEDGDEESRLQRVADQRLYAAKDARRAAMSEEALAGLEEGADASAGVPVTASSFPGPTAPPKGGA